jgi:hypothetical protein
MEDWFPVAILLIQQLALFLPPAIGECAEAPFQALLEALRKRLIGRVAVGEQRVAAGAGNRQRVELRRLERIGVVGTIGMPTFRAATVNGLVQPPVGIELVDTQQRDLWHLWMPCALGRMWHHDAKAAAVAQELLECEFLVAHHHHVVVEPGLIDRRKAGVIQRPHIDTGDLDADLRSHAADLNHGYASL